MTQRTLSGDEVELNHPTFPRLSDSRLTGISGAMVKRRRPRRQVDRAQQQAAVEKFMAAISTGR